MEKFEKFYTEEEAQKEASYLKEIVESGEAKDYSEAERIAEVERKVEVMKDRIMHPYYYEASKQEEQKNISKELLRGLYYDSDDYHELGNDPNRLILGGGDEIYYSLKNDDYQEEEKPSLEYKGSRYIATEKEIESIYKAFDRKFFNAIRIEFNIKNINFPHLGECKDYAYKHDVEGKLKKYLDDGENILDTLKKLEDQNLIKIGHIPEFYIDNEALKDTYEIEFATRKELDEFLESDLGKSSSPEKVLRRARYLDGETIKSLLKRYKDQIDLSKVVSFDADSIIQNLDKSDKLKILDIVISVMEERTDENIKELEKRLENYWEQPMVSRYGQFEPGLTKESQTNIDSRLSFLRSAATQGLIPSDFREIIKKIYEATNHYPTGYYSDRVINNQREDIEKTALLLEKLSNDKREIVGEGLEFVSSEYGESKQVYLDGELVGSFVNAEFSEKSTNGEVVAWVTREIIDQNRVTGTQNRDRVFAWKKGMKEPQEIFEDHAWSSERYLRVFAPEVDDDGTIKVEIISGDKKEKKEFKV